MRQLAVCFITIYLALASGQNVPKRYEYPNKELLHSDVPFVNNQLVYGVCEGSDPVKKCKIYQESILDESKAIRSCNLDISYTCSFSSNVMLRHTGKDHVVLAVKDYGPKYKLVTLNMANCAAKETSIEPDLGTHVTVVPKDGNFDVFFEKSKLCEDFVCKATYDYDGKVVKEAAATGVKAARARLAVNVAGQGLFIGQHRAGELRVHFVLDGDKDTKILYTSPVTSLAEPFSLSTASSKLGFCAQISRAMKCQQYNADGTTKILEIDRPITVGTYDSIDVLNLEKGMLVLTIEYAMNSNGQPPAYIAKYDEQGKKVKSVSADLNCREGGYNVPKLYRNFAGEYCVASVCRQYLILGEADTKFARSNRCFAKTELD